MKFSQKENFLSNAPVTFFRELRDLSPFFMNPLHTTSTLHLKKKKILWLFNYVVYDHQKQIWILVECVLKSGM